VSYIDHYIKGKKLDPVTVKTIVNRIKNGLIPILGKKRLSSLKPEFIQSLQNQLYSKYSEGYAHQVMCQLRRILKRAVIWEYIEKDPSLGVDAVYPKYGKPEILDPQQIVGVIYNERIPLRARAIIALGGFAGLRPGEISGLRKDKIDFKGKTIKIDLQYSHGILKPPKGHKERHIPILPDLEPVLKEWYISSGPGTFLFANDKGAPLSYSTWLIHDYKPALQAADLLYIKPHSLRHAFSKMLSDYGVPAREKMQILGHSSKKMSFEVYDRERIESMIKVTRSIEVFKKFSSEYPQNM
jgi:integrase